MSAKPTGVVKEIRTLPDATVVVLSGEVDLHQSPTLHASAGQRRGRPSAQAGP